MDLFTVFEKIFWDLLHVHSKVKSCYVEMVAQLLMLNILRLNFWEDLKEKGALNLRWL